MINHCIRKNDSEQKRRINGLYYKVYYSEYFVFIIIIFFFYFDIANKVIYLTFNTAAGWYNFLQKYYNYYIISI